MLEHTEKIEALIKAGERKEAMKVHNAYVKSQFEKAQQGQVINLTDLMAGKEAFLK